MSDIPENTTGENSSSLVKPNGRICRVAYTLNNDQPVVCTIIGDQPMFYMDFEEDAIEEASFLDDQEIMALEKEVSRLKREIDEFERFAGMFDEGEEKKRQQFHDNLLDVQELQVSKHDFSKASLKQKLIETLSVSRIGKAYLDFAGTHNVSIIMTPQVESAIYDRKSATIQINPDLPFADIVLLGARELRRHWQHRQGALINPLIFQPDNAILINRIQCADLNASMVRIAWEIQLGGEKSVWERLENSPMADLARAFAQEAFLDFRTINNGIASAAVFEAWFLSERCKYEDKELIQKMLTDTQGYVFDTGEPIKSVTADIIAALGSMPFGKNYLAQHAMTIMDDAIFTEVRDRSNANFLWFIKFERSFRETEHDLQNSQSSSSRSGNHNNQTEKSHAQSGQAEIVQFNPQQNNAASLTEQGILSAESKTNTGTNAGAQSRKKNAAEGAEAENKIIYLRKWSAD